MLDELIEQEKLEEEFIKEHKINLYGNLKQETLENITNLENEFDNNLDNSAEFDDKELFESNKNYDS